MITIFAETNRILIGERGRVGMVRTSAIATDDTTKYFFQDMINGASLVNLYDFENQEKLFSVVAPPLMFRWFTLSGQKSDIASSDFVFSPTKTFHLDVAIGHVKPNAAESATGRSAFFSISIARACAALLGKRLLFRGLYRQRPARPVRW